jgi:hypothetical protein
MCLDNWETFCYLVTEKIKHNPLAYFYKYPINKILKSLLTSLFKLSICHSDVNKRFKNDTPKRNRIEVHVMLYIFVFAIGRAEYVGTLRDVVCTP